MASWGLCDRYPFLVIAWYLSAICHQGCICIRKPLCYPSLNYPVNFHCLFWHALLRLVESRTRPEVVHGGMHGQRKRLGIPIRHHSLRECMYYLPRIVVWVPLLYSVCFTGCLNNLFYYVCLTRSSYFNFPLINIAKYKFIFGINEECIQ